MTASNTITDPATMEMILREAEVVDNWTDGTRTGTYHGYNFVAYPDRIEITGRTTVDSIRTEKEIKKTGNSLCVMISKEVQKLGLKEGDLVAIRLSRVKDDE